MRRPYAALVGLFILLADTAGAATTGRQFGADVEVRVDGHGRMVVLIDEVDAGGRSDGFVDHVVLYTATRQLRPHPVLRIPAAAVFASDDRVSVRAGDGWRLDLEIRDDRPEVEDVGAAGVTLRNGIGLQVTTTPFDGRSRTFSEIDTDDWVTVMSADDSRWCGDDCQSGGPGSSTCSQRCEWIVGTGTHKQECTVKCSKGNYACCCCIGLASASCTCRQETGAIAPGGGRVEPKIR